VYASPAERQRETTGSDPELKSGALTRQLGEEGNRRLDD